MVKDLPFQKVIVARFTGDGICIKNPWVDVELYPRVPLYFFAGPILGAPDWQLELFRLLQARLRCFIAVIPTRYPTSHPLYPHRLDGVPDYFKRQRRFEAYYIKLAREALRKHPGGGALLFNLCCQVEPRQDGRPYGTDSWREAAETYTRLEYEEDLCVLVRAQEGFPGSDVLHDCFNEATGGTFPFYATLAELAFEAARLAPEDALV